MSFKLILQADVGPKGLAVFMEVKKGSAATVEHAARLLPQCRDQAKLFQERLQPVECFGCGVLHSAILELAQSAYPRHQRLGMQRKTGAKPSPLPFNQACPAKSRGRRACVRRPRCGRD